MSLEEFTDRVRHYLRHYQCAGCGQEWFDVTTAMESRRALIELAWSGNHYSGAPLEQRALLVAGLIRKRILKGDRAMAGQEEMTTQHWSAQFWATARRLGGPVPHEPVHDPYTSALQHWAPGVAPEMAAARWVQGLMPEGTPVKPVLNGIEWSNRFWAQVCHLGGPVCQGSLEASYPYAAEDYLQGKTPEEAAANWVQRCQEQRAGGKEPDPPSGVPEMGAFTNPWARMVARAALHLQQGRARQGYTDLVNVLEDVQRQHGEGDEPIPGVTEIDERGYLLVRKEDPAKFKPFFLFEDEQGELVFTDSQGRYQEVSHLDPNLVTTKRRQVLVVVHAESLENAKDRYRRGKIAHYQRGEQVFTYQPDPQPLTVYYALVQGELKEVNVHGVFKDPLFGGETGLLAKEWASVSAFDEDEARRKWNDHEWISHFTRDLVTGRVTGTAKVPSQTFGCLGDQDFLRGEPHRVVEGKVPGSIGNTRIVNPLLQGDQRGGFGLFREIILTDRESGAPGFVDTTTHAASPDLFIGGADGPGEEPQVPEQPVERFVVPSAATVDHIEKTLAQIDDVHRRARVREGLQREGLLPREEGTDAPG